MDNDPASQGLPADTADDDDSLTIRLASPELIVEMGGDVVETVAVLINPTQEDERDQYAFAIDGINPAWYTLNVKSVLLQRGDRAEVRVRFAVPRRGAVPDVYTYRLIAQSVSHPLVQTTTVGQIRLSSPPTLRLRLDPPSATGNTAQYALQLHSGPASDLVVDLVGHDPDNALAFTPMPPRLRLGANEDAQATLGVAIREGVIGEARAYPFTLVADLSSGDEGEVPVEAEGVFVHVPVVALDVRAELTQIRGPRADYRITLTNPTSLTLAVELEARDQGNPIDIYFSGENEDNIRLERAASITFKMLVLITEEVPLGQSRVYQFALHTSARNTNGPGELEQTARYDLVYLAGAASGGVAVAAPRSNLVAPLRLSLDPPEGEGNSAAFAVGLENSGDQGVLVVLDAQDSGGELAYDFELPQLYAGPGRRAQTTLRATLRPDAPGATAAETRRYPFTVQAWAPAGDDTRLSAAATLLRPYVAPLDSIFEAVLLPVEPSGVEGSYDVRLINGSGVPLRVVVRGRDPSGLLTFSHSTLPVSLAPAGEQTVRLRVRPNALEPLAEEHTYPFEVICWLPGTDKMHALSGELRYISF